MTNKDYGIRPALFNDYTDMMSTMSKKAVTKTEVDSEFEQPYMSDDYINQAQLHHKNNHPFLSPRDMGIRADNPEDVVGDDDCGCQGAVLNAEPSSSTILCGKELVFWMAGNDGCGKVWNNSKIQWVLTGVGSINGNTYTAPDCPPIDCNHKFDDTATIRGFNDCGYSSIIITINYPWPDIPLLTISGSESIIVGSAYAGSGGLAPYTYSISCGSISSVGVVTSVTGCCGAGTITVRDECGNIASMVGRFASGSWVLVSDTGHCSYGHNCSFVVISGAVKTEYWHWCTTPFLCGDGGCATSPVACAPHGCDSPNVDCLTSIHIYNWVCP